MKNNNLCLITITDTGEGIEEGSIWAEGFGNFADQGTLDGILGYKSYTYGTALGFDMLTDTNVTLGISGGYAYTQVDPKAAKISLLISSESVFL